MYGDNLVDLAAEVEHGCTQFRVSENLLKIGQKATVADVLR